MSDIVLCVKLSTSAFQLTHPGLNEDDFTLEMDFTIENIKTYVDHNFYSVYTPLRKIYFCCSDCLCRKMDMNAFGGHLRSKKHLQMVNECGITLFYGKICDICQLLLLGSDINVLKSHFTSAEHKYDLKNRLEFLQNQVDLYQGDNSKKYGWSGDLTESSIKMFSSLDTLCTIVQEQLFEVETVLDYSKYLHKTLEQEIRLVLKNRFPWCKAHFFGSRVFGLAVQDSDVDVFVNLGEDNFDIEEVAKIFQEYSSLFKLERVVNSARVPIIIMNHCRSSLRVDLNIKNMEGVYNSLLIRTYLNLDPRIPWLVIAVRAWATDNGIRGTKKFTNYSLLWLVLFFLMQPEISLVPCVARLRNLHDGPKIICNGWNYSFSTDIRKINSLSTPRKCREEPLELLELFFNFYTVLKTKKVVLFPSTGEILTRHSYANPVVGRGIHDNPLDSSPVRIGGPFILIDPINLKENLLRPVDENLADHFISICQKTMDCGWISSMPRKFK